MILLTLGFLAATAYADFIEPLDVSAPGRTAADPEVATDADGDSLAVWRGFDDETGLWRIQARTISAAGAKGEVRTLSGLGTTGMPTVREARVATDADGDSIVAWQDIQRFSSRIHARIVSSAGALGPRQTLGKGLTGGLEVATDADGDSIAVWLRRTEMSDFSWTEARTISASGVLGPKLRLSGEALSTWGAPEVATDADGDSIVVWPQLSAGADRIQMRTISSTGAVGPVRSLTPSTGTSSAHSPQVATDANGDSIVAWGRGGGVQARTVSFSGVRGPILKLSAPGNAGNGDPRVATDPDGDAIVIWPRDEGPGGDDSRIQARRISSGGVLSPVQDLTGGHIDRNAEVATDADGDSVVIWHRDRGDGELRKVQARTVSATGVRGPIQTLSTRAVGIFHGPRVATDGDGDAIAVWERFDGANDRVAAALGP